MNIPKLTLITLIVSAFIASSIIAADKDKTSMKDMNMTPMTDMLKGKSGDEFEAHFLGMMVMHHKDGVKMAKMAQEKASSSELKQMMQKAEKEQQSEIDQMTGWLQQWHKKSPNDFDMSPDSKKMMDMSMSELKGLSGAQFDASFAKHMAHHHEDAIAMAKLAQTKAQHAEVKTLASRIVSSQTEERQKLEKIARGSSSGGTAQYTCSMHPEVVQSGPGKCPKCGMALEQKKGDEKKSS